MPSDDHTKQFLAGCVLEGKLQGYEVDTFISNGDDKRMQELVSEATNGGYDGLVISHGKADYSYDMIKPAVDNGIPIVTFDTIVEKNGEKLSSII